MKGHTGKIEATLKEVEKFMIPPFDGVVDSVTPDKGFEVLHGELTHE